MSDEKQEHRWVKLKRFKWLVCQRCDLALLNNDATARRVKQGCIGQFVTISAPKSLNQQAAEGGGVGR